jgi:LacI family gluconate utilization system Gnt-I transcriptional repressor
MLAGGLASSESRVVAAIVPTLANSIFAEMIQGVYDVLSEEQYRLVLGSSNYDPAQEEALVKVFLSHLVAGIIITGASHSAGTASLLAKSGIPVVETWSLLGEPSVGSVGFSNRDASYAIVRHLYERGYRRLGFVSASLENNDRSQERLRGYREALADFGLERREDVILTNTFSLAAGAESLRKILERRPDTDAIFCANDTLAAGALLEARRLGLDVPGRVAIAGFDDLETSSHVMPALTTVRIRRREIGCRAAEMLLSNLAGEALVERKIDLGFEIVVRAST